MSNAFLIGAWVLREYSISKLGEVRKAEMGVRGFIIYSADGIMSASINTLNKGIKEVNNYQFSFKATKNVEVNVSLVEPLEKFTNPFEPYIFYSGPYQFLDDKTIRHHLWTCSKPQAIGTFVDREFKLEGNSLQIISRETPAGEIVLRWEKYGERKSSIETKDALKKASSE